MFLCFNFWICHLSGITIPTSTKLHVMSYNSSSQGQTHSLKKILAGYKADVLNRNWFLSRLPSLENILSYRISQTIKNCRREIIEHLNKKKSAKIEVQLNFFFLCYFFNNVEKVDNVNVSRENEREANNKKYLSLSRHLTLLFMGVSGWTFNDISCFVVCYFSTKIE